MSAAAMAALDLILSRAAATASAIQDRVTDRADQVLGKPKQVKQKVIWAVGDFPNPWGSDPDEIAEINAGNWFPSTDDFIAVLHNSGSRVRKPPIVVSTSSFINLILSQGKGSITQLNLVTHGSSSSIGLGGTIESGAVYFEEELDAGVLQGFRDNGIEGKDGSIIPFSVVKARFAKDAVIVIYACKAALSSTLLQDIADTFGVTVRAFTAELHYNYSEKALTAGQVNRLELKVDGKKSLTSLSPNVSKMPTAP